MSAPDTKIDQQIATIKKLVQDYIDDGKTAMCLIYINSMKDFSPIAVKSVLEDDSIIDYLISNSSSDKFMECVKSYDIDCMKSGTNGSILSKLITKNKNSHGNLVKKVLTYCIEKDRAMFLKCIKSLDVKEYNQMVIDVILEKSGKSIKSCYSEFIDMLDKLANPVNPINIGSINQNDNTLCVAYSYTIPNSIHNSLTWPGNMGNGITFTCATPTVQIASVCTDKK